MSPTSDSFLQENRILGRTDVIGSEKATEIPDGGLENVDGKSIWIVEINVLQQLSPLHRTHLCRPISHSVSKESTKVAAQPLRVDR